jgi:hypothetical protein
LPCVPQALQRETVTLFTQEHLGHNHRLSGTASCCCGCCFGGAAGAAGAATGLGVGDDDEYLYG